MAEFAVAKLLWKLLSYLRKGVTFVLRTVNCEVLECEIFGA